MLTNYKISQLELYKGFNKDKTLLIPPTSIYLSKSLKSLQHYSSNTRLKKILPSVTTKIVALVFITKSIVITLYGKLSNILHILQLNIFTNSSKTKINSTAGNDAEVNKLSTNNETTALDGRVGLIYRIFIA